MSRQLVASATGSGVLLVCLYFDAGQPLSVAVGTSYVVAVAFGLLARSKRLLTAFGSAAVLFIVLGMFLSPAGDDAQVALVNRSLAVLVTVAVTVLGYELIAGRERFGRRMLEMARTDDLTGARNRRALLAEIEQRVKEHERYGTELSILMFDVDRFKALNDRYGHLMGDRVLRTLGRTCLAVARETDVVGRYGGDEFIVVCPNTRGENAAALGARMSRAIAATKVPGLPVCERVTISLGVASMGPSVGSATALIGNADRALYAAKRAARGDDQVPSAARGRRGFRGAAAAARHARRAPRRCEASPR